MAWCSKWNRFVNYLSRNNLPWPQLASGDPDMKDQTFKEMGELYPQVEPLRQLRHTLSQLRLSDLAVGPDDRNRCMLGQFVASTGRNAPKASQYIFGPSTWLRGLIKPEAGRALAYIDWSSQEIGIAAALSEDANLLGAVISGDPYIYFAKMAKLVPDDATKDSHPAVRETCKRCMLGVNYGMGELSLAFRINKSTVEARDLLRRHREIFPRFWAWSRDAVRVASLSGHLDMAFGWRVHDGPETRPQSLMNRPCKGTRAEMMRLAAIAGVRSGVQIDAVIHDAFLVESDREPDRGHVASMQAAMAVRVQQGAWRAGAADGCQAGSHWPGRYMDSRPAAKAMWARVMGILAEVERKEPGIESGAFDPHAPRAPTRTPHVRHPHASYVHPVQSSKESVSYVVL